MSIVNKLVEGGHLTSEQVERIGESVHEFMKEADANPAIVNEYLEKVSAGNPALWKQMAMATGLGLAASGAGVLGNVGIQAVRGWMNDVKKAKRYKEMLEANPELKSKGVNSKMVQMHFNTLNRFNPDYAADPLVAGAYVQNQLESARPNIESLNNIVQARKNQAEIESRDSMIGASQAAMQPAVDVLKQRMESRMQPAQRTSNLEKMKQMQQWYKTKSQMEQNLPHELQRELIPTVRGAQREILKS